MAASLSIEMSLGFEKVSSRSPVHQEMLILWLLGGCFQTVLGLQVFKKQPWKTPETVMTSS